MRKALYALFVMILSFSVYSCEDENEDIIRERDILNYADWVAVSGNDSIRIEFYSSVTIYQYDTSTSPATLKSEDYYSAWSTDGKGSMVLHRNYNKVSDPLDKRLSYELKRNAMTVTGLHNKSLTFYQEFVKKEAVDPNIIVGTWHTTLSRDSVVLIFEKGTAKEYVYEKNSGDILKYTDYKSYKLDKKTYTYNDNIKIEYLAWAYKDTTYQVIMRCQLDNSRLISYVNNYPVIYTKIE